jgi:probable HAF family extracellular repeat protein
MKALAVVVIGFLAFSGSAAEPRYAIEMTPFAGGATFYNPAGDVLIGGGLIWDGQTTRSAEFAKENDKGDALVSVVTGQVLTLGNEHSLYRARVRVNGVTTTIEPFGGESSVANALNAQGHIVGFAQDASGVRQPFVFKNGVAQQLNDLIVGTVRFDMPLLIRDDGVIFGSRYLDGGAEAAVQLTPRADGKYDAVQLATLPTSIKFNSKGDIIFKSGLWRDGKTNAIGDFGLPNFFYPESVNSAGEIVGVAMTPDDHNYHGFYWDGQIHDMQDLVGMPAGWLASPTCDEINEYGQILANVYTGTNTMILRLTPAPKIISTETKGDTMTIRFHAGARHAISVRSTSNFVDWTEVKKIDAPQPDETAQITVSGAGSEFFKIVRVASGN